MNFRTIAGFIGVVAMMAFLAPPIIKLHKLPLIAVAIIGVCLAGYEFYEIVIADAAKARKRAAEANGGHPDTR